MFSPPSSLRTLASRSLLATSVGLLLLIVAAGTLLARSTFADAGRRRAVPNDLPLALATGASKTFANLAGKKATVFVFVGTECPISNKYAPTIFALEKAYRSKGVRFALVYANAHTTGAQASAHAKAYKFSGLPLVLDTRQTLADRVGATRTPQAVVVGGDHLVYYAGRIDDRFVDRGLERGGATGRVGERSVALALDAVLAGRPVTAGGAAVGCAIERAKTPLVLAAGPTYARDVAPILQANCVSCHRAGEIGPFALNGYADAKRWATNIAEVTAKRQMPPWKAVPGHGDFSGVRRLTDAQIATLKKWADAGAPAGNLALAPPAPKFPADGWSLGTPDLVLKMSEPWRVAAGSKDLYRCFVLPTNLTQDKDVVGVEVRAGNKRVVHHVLLYVDTKGRGRAKDESEAGQGYTNFGGPGFLPDGEMGGWAPGNLPRFLPDGIGRLLPAGSDIIMQVHYNPSGKDEDDVSQIGLFFAKKPVAKRLRIVPVAAPVNIPAGEAAYQTSVTYPVPFDARLISVMPHMHLLGRTIKLTATLPDGTTTHPLIAINDWDFNWQDTYYYKEPIVLPKGSTIRMEATYDNSANNPRNPHSPPQPVKWGEKTTDEMCLGFVGFLVDDENDLAVKILDAVTGNAARKRQTTSAIR